MEESRKHHRRRGVFVDGPRLIEIRQSIGWSQEQAGQYAGYTDRLIRKLEKGGPVNPSSLQDVLQAYSENLNPPRELNAASFIIPESASNPEELIRTWFRRAFNHRDLTVIDDMVDPENEFFSEGVIRIGPEPIRQRISSILAAFDPLILTIERVVTDTDCAVAYWTVEATHIGEFLGVSPSGRTVKTRGSSYMRFRDGKMFDSRDHWDVQDFLLQLRREDPHPA